VVEGCTGGGWSGGGPRWGIRACRPSPLLKGGTGGTRTIEALIRSTGASRAVDWSMARLLQSLFPHWGWGYRRHTGDLFPLCPEGQGVHGLRIPLCPQGATQPEGTGKKRASGYALPVYRSEGCSGCTPSIPQVHLCPPYPQGRGGGWPEVEGGGLPPLCKRTPTPLDMLGYTPPSERGHTGPGRALPVPLAGCNHGSGRLSMYASIVPCVVFSMYWDGGRLTLVAYFLVRALHGAAGVGGCKFRAIWPVCLLFPLYPRPGVGCWCYGT